VKEIRTPLQIVVDYLSNGRNKYLYYRAWGIKMLKNEDDFEEVYSRFLLTVVEKQDQCKRNNPNGWARSVFRNE
jgi:hypothetical protein